MVHRRDAFFNFPRIAFLAIAVGTWAAREYPFVKYPATTCAGCEPRNKGPPVHAGRAFV